MKTRPNPALRAPPHFSAPNLPIKPGAEQPETGSGQKIYATLSSDDPERLATAWETPA
jgi:hypothetical protein